MNDDEEYKKEFGINICLDACVDSLKGEFKLSKSQITKVLRERASEVNPPKRVSYHLQEGIHVNYDKMLDRLVDSKVKETISLMEKKKTIFDYCEGTK